MQEQSAAVRRVLRQLAGAPASSIETLLAPLYDQEVAWHGPHPLNDCAGIGAYVDTFWRPLLEACPDLERRDDILLGGPFRGERWLASTGHYVGTFANDWLGIPHTGGVLNIRFGEFSRFEGGRIVESYVILDLLDVLRQAGLEPRWRSLGAEDRVPGPATQDGIISAPADAGETARSLDLVERMIAGLMEYDGRSLASMGMERFWHPRMMWYGPGGIGTTRGLAGFQAHHQEPFLRAFPDRKGGDHKARLAEGAYVASTGWPSVRATHTGDGWLGMAATGKRVGMRVMDFWRAEGSLLVENWVFIDIIDLLLQMGVDVLAGLKKP